MIEAVSKDKHDYPSIKNESITCCLSPYGGEKIEKEWFKKSPVNFSCNVSIFRFF